MENFNFASLAKLFGNLTWERALSSLLTLLVCLVVIKIITRLVRHAFSFTQLDPRLQKFIMMGLKGLLYILTVIIVAESLGIPSTSLVALLSVASLAVSLAVQGMLSNAAGGMMLLTSRPISLGDFVQVAGITGYVDEVSLMYTKLRTPDGQIVMLPNSSISSAQITNYSTLGRRRITIKIGASYDNAVSDVRNALLEAAAKTDKLFSDPAPVVYVNDYLDSAIEYVLYAWCTADDHWTTQFALREAVKNAFDAHGIEIPYNRLDVCLTGACAQPPQSEPHA